MGLDVDFECVNHCRAGPRPKFVHPSQNKSKVEKRGIKGQSTSRYYHFKSSDGDHRELSLCNYPSPHRRSMPSRPPELNVEENLVLKRGSVYQSSSEVKMMRKIKERQGKGSSNSDKAFLSFDRVDSSIWNRRDNILFSEQRRSCLGSLNGELECIDTTRSDFPEIPGARTAPDPLKKRSVDESKFNCNQKLCPKNEGNTLYGGDIVHSFPKSFSDKVGMFNSPRQLEGETLSTIARTRFSSLKRILDPIMKSKSLQSQSLMEAETAGATAINPARRIRNGSSHKSLLNEFSKATQKMEYDKQLVVSDQAQTAGVPPSHLHSVLKLEFKNDAPSFEFSIKDTDDVIYAKTWKTDNAFNWAYTFHSSKRKNSDTGRISKDGYGQSQMVGQMQVSCFLCSEMSENGSLDNYMVTEFILYDIAQARRSFAADGRSHCSADSIRPSAATASENLSSDCNLERESSSGTDKYQNTVRRNFNGHDSDPSTSYPWSPMNLHSHMETAAIVTQIPLMKESLKEAHGEEIGGKDQKLTSLLPFDHGRDRNYNLLDPPVVKVVIPSGSHGLPNTKEGSPSSLLDRWRFCGGCDCGGWDMACPIVVFDYPCAGDLLDYSVMGSQQPMVLIFQGRKEKTPALSIADNGKGHYSVDFHAQLSALQAFSICIAVLHSSEASSIGQNRIKHKLYSNSLKLHLEEEVKHLIQTVAEKERKTKKRVDQNSPSFILDPPFSPMGRV